MIGITLRALGRGRFEARLGGRVILKSSRQPLLDAARVFLAEGVPPDTRIAMRHEDSPHVALSSSIGAAAKLTVKETTSDGRTIFTRWDTSVGARLRPPMRFGSDEPSN